MITRVKASGIKGGMSFDQPLQKRNIFIGENGSGKTARGQAIMLALLGYVPGPEKAQKQNRAIMDEYGDGKQLTVDIEIDGKRSASASRRWEVKGDSVAQQFMVGTRKKSAADYAVEIAGIKIFDLSEFLRLSGQKQLEMIFNLYPPAGDVAQLDGQIEKAKADKNRLAESIKSKEQTIKTLAQSRAAIQLPAGNLAELKARIEKTEQDLKAARENLRISMQEAAKAEAVAQLAKEQQAQAPPQSAPAVAAGDLQRPQPANLSSRVIQSLQSLIGTMDRAGCQACAARLVCLREIKKFKEGTA